MEIKQDVIQQNLLDLWPPSAFLKVEHHHPSCQQWPNEENRITPDVLTDGASPSTLVSLAGWRMDAGVDRKRQRRSLTRRLKWLLRLTARLFMSTHHQRAAIDPLRITDSEAAVMWHHRRQTRQKSGLIVWTAWWRPSYCFMIRKVN